MQRSSGSDARDHKQNRSIEPENSGYDTESAQDKNIVKVRQSGPVTVFGPLREEPVCHNPGSLHRAQRGGERVKTQEDYFKSVQDSATETRLGWEQPCAQAQHDQKQSGKTFLGMVIVMNAKQKTVEWDLEPNERRQKSSLGEDS